MKRDKKLDGFKLAVISMVVIGIGGFLILFFHALHEKQEFDEWLMKTQKAIQKASQSPTYTSSDSSTRPNMNGDIPSELSNKSIKQMDNRVKTQEAKSPTQANQPLNQKDRLPKDTPPADTEEAYYAQFDEEMNQIYGVPLEMIGIPRFEENATAMYFKPTDADQQRFNEIKEEFKDSIDKGIMAEEEREGFRSYPVRESETLYIHPDHWERLVELVEEDLAIQKRNMVEGPITRWHTMPYKQWTLPDDTVLTYYRRRNGDLVRSIKKPDGKLREWVIGWTDLTPYEKYSGDTWR